MTSSERRRRRGRAAATCPVCHWQWAAGEITADQLHDHVDDCLTSMAGF
jgi:hypothetical protein